MRPKPDRERCPWEKYSSVGKYVRRQNFVGKVCFMEMYTKNLRNFCLLKLKFKFYLRYHIQSILSMGLFCQYTNLLKAQQYTINTSSNKLLIADSFLSIFNSESSQSSYCHGFQKLSTVVCLFFSYSRFPMESLADKSLHFRWFSAFNFNLTNHE